MGILILLLGGCTLCQFHDVPRTIQRAWFIGMV